MQRRHLTKIWSFAGTVNEALQLRRHHNRLNKTSESNRFSIGDVASANIVDGAGLAVVVHCHYTDYVDKALKLFEVFPSGTRFFFTSSQRSILLELQNSPAFDPLIAETLLFPNTGRNFAPLFVGLGKRLLDFDLLFHVHSKRSPQHGEIGVSWGKSLWESLVGTKRRVLSLIGVLQQTESLGLIYMHIPIYLKPQDLGWSHNRDRASEWLLSNNFPWTDDPIDFPAGGMFACKTKAIEPLLSYDWKTSDFPLESGQMDGELHHVLERLIGVVSHAIAFNHLVVTPGNDDFGTIVAPS